MFDNFKYLVSLFLIILILKQAKAATFDRSEDIEENKQPNGNPQLYNALLSAKPLKLTRVARNEPKKEVVKELRRRLAHILQTITEHINHGKEVTDSLFEKVKEIRDKLKDLNQDLGVKAKELLEKVKDRFKDWFKKIIGDLGNK